MLFVVMMITASFIQSRLPDWASHLGLPSQNFPLISFCDVHRRTTMLQTDLCPPSCPQTPHRQQLAHSYYQAHCSVPPRRLTCLSCTFSFTLWSGLLPQEVYSVSEAGLCVAARSSSPDHCSSCLMFSSHWPQSALPHAGGPGVGGTLAWGNSITVKEAAAIFCGSLRKGSFEQPPRRSQR